MSEPTLVSPFKVSKPPLPPPPATAPRPARLGWLAALVVFFALGNLGFLPLLIQTQGPSTPILIAMGLVMGGIIAQMLIVSFFAVLGPGGTLVRQGIVWLVAVALIGSFAAGVAIASAMDTSLHIGGPGVSMLVSLFAVPAVLCACQTPLWSLRYFARWRTGMSDGGAQDSGQISIRGMLAATAVVAVVLGLCRLGLSIDHMRWEEERLGDAIPSVYWWSGIGIASAIALAVSLVVLPVTSLLVLRSSSGILGVVYAAAYLAACALTFVVVISIIARNPPGEEGCTILFMYFVSITGYLLTSLAIFRSAGYRLWWGRAE